ncbi:histidine--tRNA ligase [Brevundimonas sp.]|uniref:histidine--tRNA ligase n=1 Tax=Brevundimonas sp. TaxID=1871086 RepID=UPI001D401A44|nr:histidine--tRNA ligase [Brevundimonas sp.]MBL0947976.1 histidine--tRNA ligase [Brevundimonas sp.]
MTTEAPSDAPTAEAPRPEARGPRGFQDRRGPDLIAERRIVERVSAVYERWGFEPLQTSAFEYADALGKFLPDADRPNEGVFALQDDDDQWMALRYDLTAPLARYAAQSWETLPKPFRRYAFGPVWRNEKPGPGRFREFIQCDADTVGSDRPEADAEIVAMACEGLRSAGLDADQAIIKINNRKLLNALLSTLNIHDPWTRLAVLRSIDKLDRLGIEGVELLLGVHGRVDESGDKTEGAGLNDAAVKRVLEFVSAGGADRMSTTNNLANVIGASKEGDDALLEMFKIDAALSSMNVPASRATFDPTVVRGLEYYTGVVFEAELLLPTTDERGRPVRFGSIGGGGRYDDLVARFTGQSVPATGFSFGVSRLAAALRASGRDPAGEVRGPVVVIAFSDADMAHYLGAVAELRTAGIAAELYLGRAGMKAQMKYADRRGAPVAVMLGGDEIAAGTVTLKDLDAGRRLSQAVADNAEWKQARPGQQTLPRDQMVGAIRSILEGVSTTG